MVRLVKITFVVAAGTAQMDEPDAIAELFHHGGQFVVAANAERSGTKAKSVRTVRNGRNQCTKIVRRAQNTRQAENRIRRIVRMDHQFDARFIGHRSDLAQKSDQVFAQPGGVDPLVLAERPANCSIVKLSSAPGNPAIMFRVKPLAFDRIHPVEACFRLARSCDVYSASAPGRCRINRSNATNAARSKRSAFEPSGNV